MIEPNIDIVIDCHDLEAQLDFWSAALEYRKIGIKDNYGLLVPHERAYPPVVLQRVPEPKTAKTRVHFDLRVDDVETKASELEALGDVASMSASRRTQASSRWPTRRATSSACVQERHLTGDPGDRSARVPAVQITAIIDYGNELLVSLATQDAPLAGVFGITASTGSLTRVRRWHDESTTLRAYLSYDGAIMLADPALGGNAPCEPPTPDTYHTRDEATPTTTHQPRTNDPRAADLGRRGPDLAHAVDNADRADRWRASTCTEI